MGKGSKRRNEDREAIERNWPFPVKDPRQIEMPLGTPPEPPPPEPPVGQN